MEGRRKKEFHVLMGSSNPHPPNWAPEHQFVIGEEKHWKTPEKLKLR
jgi:hypothetical protein